MPASLAWATVVHQIFDFRVALRAAAVTLMLAIAGVLAYVTGEWLAGTWWPDFGAEIAGGALAFVALAASLAGPLAPWLGMLGTRVVPAAHDDTLDAHSLSPASAEPGIDPMELIWSRPATRCAVPATRRILALVADNGTVRPPNGVAGTMREPVPASVCERRSSRAGGIRSVDEAPLETGDRDALEAAGVGWLLPVAASACTRCCCSAKARGRLALAPRELELERFADRLSVSLENAVLRSEARSRGALDRD